MKILKYLSISKEKLKWYHVISIKIFQLSQKPNKIHFLYVK